MKHKILHKKDDSRCRQCRKTFANTKQINHHKHMNLTEKITSVRLVNMYFTSTRCLKSHTRQKHADLQIKGKPAKTTNRYKNQKIRERTLPEKQNPGGGAVADQSRSRLISHRQAQGISDQIITRHPAVPGRKKWTPKTGQHDKCLLGSSHHPGSRFVVNAVRCTPVKRLVPSPGIVEGEIPAQ